MGANDGITGTSEMVGVTIDDAFEAAIGARREVTVAPENSSRRSTVSGPVAAAVRCGNKLKNHL